MLSYCAPFIQGCLFAGSKDANIDNDMHGNIVVNVFSKQTRYSTQYDNQHVHVFVRMRKKAILHPSPSTFDLALPTAVFLAKQVLNIQA